MRRCCTAAREFLSAALRLEPRDHHHLRCRSPSSPGVTGAFFKFLSLTMASALVISLILTAFTVPLLARGIIDFGSWHDPSHGKETWLKRTHGRLLGRLFARPILLAPGVAVLLAVGLFAYLRVGTGFLPRMDEGGFVLDYHTAPGHLAGRDQSRAVRGRGHPQEGPVCLHLLAPHRRRTGRRPRRERIRAISSSG